VRRREREEMWSTVGENAMDIDDQDSNINGVSAKTTKKIQLAMPTPDLR
jgi:hypothetical protein